MLFSSRKLAVLTSTLFLFTKLAWANGPTTDLVLVGAANWGSIPVASSNGNGTFTVTNRAVNDFPAWSTTPGVKIVTGDFNGDGKTDVALVGAANWGSIPLALSNGNGGFSVTNLAVKDFPIWATSPGVKIITGDFNGDGKTDLALSGPANWGSIPVALSNGNGTFTVSNYPVNDFPVWATTPNVEIITGDFNGDGKTDLALSGPANWGSIPVALSNGNGTFTVFNYPVSDFPVWATTPGVKIIAGDFNGDGRTDLALSGPANWGSIPVALSNGNGTFTVSNYPVNDFPLWATTPGVKILTGDFNGDGKTDFALSGPANWGSIPVALSNGNGTFTVSNYPVNDFPLWATTPGVQIVTGDFNGDGKTDFALSGPANWGSIPVALSNGNGTFTVSNYPVNDFPLWATTPGVKILAGTF